MSLVSDSLELAELRVLLAIVESGSLAGASRSINQSRSTLRRALAELEDRVGLPLVASKEGRLVATQAGKHLVDGARPLLASADILIDEARSVGEQLGRRLRVSVPPGVPPHVMQLVTAAFRTEFEEAVDFWCVDNPLNYLGRGSDLYMYLGAEPPAGPWDSVRIAPAEHGLVGSRRYLEHRGTPRTLADLDDHVLAVWQSDPDSPTELPLRDRTRLPVTPILSTNDSYRLWATASAGLHLSMVPDAHLTLPEFPDVVRVLPDVVGEDLAAWAVVPNELAYSKRLGAMLNNIRAVITGLTPQA